MEFKIVDIEIICFIKLVIFLINIFFNLRNLDIIFELVFRIFFNFFFGIFKINFIVLI